jgi:hypothetical protein
MATLTVASQLTLTELAKRTNNGNLLEIAEVLATSKDLLQDAAWLEANQLVSHVGTRRVRLPAGTHRQANQGVAPEASGTRQIAEPICRLEGQSKVDEAILDVAPDRQYTRSQEDLAFVEGLAQTMETVVFYGNLAAASTATAGPATIDGFSVRSDYSASTQYNTQSSGGVGATTTSLWVIEWGPRQVHFIYPKGSKAGLDTVDMGKQLVADAVTAANSYFCWFTQFIIWYGLFIWDPRYVQRVMNIASSGSVNTLNDDDIIRALNKMPKPGGGPTARIYANRTLKTMFDILAKDKTNVNYFIDKPFGEPLTIFRTVPIRLSEALVNTETAA